MSFANWQAIPPVLCLLAIDFHLLAKYYGDGKWSSKQFYFAAGISEGPTRSTAIPDTFLPWNSIGWKGPTVS